MRCGIIISGLVLIDNPQCPRLNVVRDKAWYDLSVSHEAGDVTLALFGAGHTKTERGKVSKACA